MQVVQSVLRRAAVQTRSLRLAPRPFYAAGTPLEVSGHYIFTLWVLGWAACIGEPSDNAEQMGFGHWCRYTRCALDACSIEGASWLFFGDCYIHLV
jgi:hypothetical protein